MPGFICERFFVTVRKVYLSKQLTSENARDKTIHGLGRIGEGSVRSARKEISVTNKCWFGTLASLEAGIVLAAPSARAQFEINPDHFDPPNMVL